ncbi:WGxxGxxG family protein [Cohnella suwonensis]|uniref:WGxxGxxG family protein n=1 Tax=Cohnella suwonensis TaxID=696072 RepID=A0ABW0LNC2_9BACL
MRKQVTSLALASALSLTIAVPAFASHSPGHTTADMTPGTNPSTINSTTNTTSPTYNPRYNQVNYNGGTHNGMFSDTTTGTRFDTYNNGTNRPFGTYGAYDSTRMNAYRPNGAYNTGITAKTNQTVRALGTTTRRTFNWGWLGLLGLFGLAGMRSRNRDEAR